jgi:arginine utilization protein RocB
MGMLGGMAGMIPGVGGVAGAVVATAAATAISVASMSGGFKSKDEVAFEYHVATVEGAVIIPPTVTKQKAKKDGEDVLTPQIAQAAKLTLEKVSPPKPE